MGHSLAYTLSKTCLLYLNFCGGTKIQGVRGVCPEYFCGLMTHCPHGQRYRCATGVLRCPRGGKAIDDSLPGVGQSHEVLCYINRRLASDKGQSKMYILRGSYYRNCFRLLEIKDTFRKS